jgi:hypothetical protein
MDFINLNEDRTTGQRKKELTLFKTLIVFKSPHTVRLQQQCLVELRKTSQALKIQTWRTPRLQRSQRQKK